MKNNNITAKFGQFLTQLANDTSVPDIGNTFLKEMQEKLRQERRTEIENKLKSIFQEIQTKVTFIRGLRRNERAALAEIKSLEKRAEDVLAGRDVES